MASPFDNTNPLFRPFLAPNATPEPMLGNTIAMPQSVPTAAIAAPIVPVQRAPRASELAQQAYTSEANKRAGVDRISNPLIRGIAKAGDIAASVFAPRIAQFIPGTTLDHQRQVGIRANQAKEAEAQDKAQTDIAGNEAQAAREAAITSTIPQKSQDEHRLAEAQVGHLDAQTQTALHPQVKPKSIEEQAYDYAITQGKNPLDAYSAVYGAKNTKDSSLPQQYLEAIQSGDTVKADLIKKTIETTQVQPKIDVHAATASEGSSGTWTPGFDANKNPVMFNNKTGEVKLMQGGGFSKNTAAQAKIGSDEQKRADLAQNLNENVDQLEEIARRRPELFGPIAGRYTELRNTLGTSDPDITRLEAIRHNLGMVAQGAHGMRSAEGVERSANSLINGFHNSPEATIQGLEAARNSVQTFLKDSQSPGQPRSGGSVQTKTYQGHTYEKGPNGWQLVK